VPSRRTLLGNPLLPLITFSVKEGNTMFRLIWAASIHTHTVLRWAPTNLLLNRIRTRRGLKWGIPAMLLAAPYFLAAASCTQLIKNSGSSWLTPLVALFIWDAFKFVCVGPLSLLRLLSVVVKEHRARDAEMN
jgi:hypothetical protein